MRVKILNESGVVLQAPDDIFDFPALGDAQHGLDSFPHDDIEETVPAAESDVSPSSALVPEYVLAVHDCWDL